jgi:hypothetical protein
MWSPPRAQAREKMFAAESTPLPCAPPMTQLSEFVIKQDILQFLTFNTLQNQPPVTASYRQHSQASFLPQYGQTHMHDSIWLPQLSHIATSSFVSISFLVTCKVIILC